MVFVIYLLKVVGPSSERGESQTSGVLILDRTILILIKIVKNLKLIHFIDKNYRLEKVMSNNMNTLSWCNVHFFKLNNY